MAFPDDPVDLLVELDLVGDWSDPEDITTYVQRRDDLTITRGKSAEGTVADPSTLTLTLNNRDGRFSPRNPTGAYFGKLGRNTPIRVSVVEGEVRATSSDPTGGVYFCNDSTGTSITGDIDIRIDLARSWRNAASQRLAVKWADPSQRSWFFQLDDTGKLHLFWSSTGSNLLGAVSTVPVPFPVAGRKAVRVTLDVNNGASGNTTTFYTADTIAGPWTQLGDPVVQSGTTSIFDSTSGNAVTIHDAEVYAFEVRSGIGGTVKASPDFTAQAEGDVTFTDAQGNSWTSLQASVSCTARRFRFYGEVSSWPVKWDSSGQDVYVQVTAAGVLRRLGQASTALRSALYRGVTTDSDVVAYWPAEDGKDAASIGPGLDHRPMTVTGTPSFASFDGFASSAPLPVLAGSAWAGQVPAYTSTSQMQVRFLMAVPDSGEANGAVIARVFCSGTARRFDLVYGSTFSGTLALKVYGIDGTLAYDSGAVNYAVNGKLVQLSIEAVQDVLDVDVRFSALNVESTAAGYTSTTITPATVGVVQRVAINPNGTLTDTAVGHIYAQSAQSDIFDLLDQLRAWTGEAAGVRFARLCAEEGFAVDMVGYEHDTSTMGPQLPGTLLELLRECADADQGLLYEPRTMLGLSYRTRVSLHNQSAALSLDYASQHLTELDPVDDDQAVRNDVTVARASASSYRTTLDEGALSTQDPPNGVGRYTDSLTVNVETDGLLPDLAGWRLHLGTVDEPRYPAIGVQLERAPFVASAALTSDVVDTDVGDQLTLTGLPAWLPPDDVDQLVRGYTETLSNFSHAVTFVGEPASPWQVGIYDDPGTRYTSDGSTLAAAVTSSATSLSIATPAGPLWGHGDGDFDIAIGGEVMTVTAVSGTSSPQTFTVTRAVNGVSKAQAAGQVVELAPPMTYAI